MIILNIEMQKEIKRLKNYWYNLNIMGYQIDPKDLLLDIGELSLRVLLFLVKAALLRPSMRMEFINKQEYELFSIIFDFEPRVLRKKVNKSLETLQKHGLIEKTRTKQKLIIQITNKGKRFAEFREKLTADFKKVDKGKRFVIFDIPEKERKKRNILRTYLKLIGYVELQKSVFISEYDNKAAVDEIVELLEIREFTKTGIMLID